MVIQALVAGHSFASEAPPLWLSCGRVKMGGVIHKKPGMSISIRFTAADSVGLHSVRIVSDGKVVREITAKDEPKITGVLDSEVRAEPSYFRVECTATDQRRAFSSPIFVLPMREPS